MSRYDFTTEPLEYATNMLRGHTLSQGLGEKFDLREGTFHTYLPPQTSSEEALILQRAKERFRPEDEKMLPKNMVIAEISSFLTQNQRSIFCVEDFLARATDPWFTKGTDDENTFVFGDELYYYTFNNEAPEDDVEYLLRSVEDCFYVGVVSVLDEDMSSVGVRKIDEQELSAIVSGARKIVFGAYERQSFILWEPADG